MSNDTASPPSPFHWARIEIRRFRILKHLDLEREPANTDLGQWTLLIGDNGVGKTSFLQAIALAVGTLNQISPLAGWLSKIGVPTAGIKDSGGRTSVRTALVGAIEVRGDEVNCPLWAYGSQRGSALGGPDRAVELTREAPIDGLFDPDWRLIHAETWLKNLKHAALEKNGEAMALFESIRDLLTEVLHLKRIEVSADGVRLFGEDGNGVPLSQWSDGYLTTAGWILDLIARWTMHATLNGIPFGADFCEQMTGLVLIDEIDLHLHPIWQTQIVRDLRRIFPRLSFIATTHNPLTLLGAEKGEIYVLRRNSEGEIEAIPRDIPPGLDVDQVLTGDWFGLSSTLDADTLKLLDRHRALLRAGTSKDDPERKTLEAQLQQRLGWSAETSVERMVQSIAAELLPPKLEDVVLEERSELREKILAAARSRKA